MRNVAIKWVMVFSTFAVIILAIFQLNWLNQSKDLIEKQFDQKVTMALCQSIDEVCNPENPNNCVLTGCSEDIVRNKVFNDRIRTNFDRYDVGLKYEMEILPQKPTTDISDPSYGCALDVHETDTTQWLAVQFPDKGCYVTAKMRFMSWSTFLLLAFIGGVFVWANYLLWKQKKLHQKNIDSFNHMAHELRTPLTSMALASRLMIKENQQLKKNKYFNVLQNQNKQLRNQVNLLMMSSQLDHKPVSKQWIKLSEIMSTIREDFGLILEEVNGELIISPFDPDLHVYGNQFHLLQAFKNLVENSIKYRKENLKIQIHVTQHKDGVEVSFRDNGLGIDSKDQPYIFEKFHRATNSSTEPGFGLGLSYVKSVADIHQGFIKFISTLNQGSQFNFFIPNLK